MPRTKKASKRHDATRPPRRLVVDLFVSMDGVLQAPGDPDEDPSDDFPHGGWSMTYWDEAMGLAMEKTMAEPHELLLGRKTYDIFAAYWPRQSDSNAVSLNRAKKYVASRTKKELDWENSTLIQGNLTDAVRELKRNPGPPLHVIGSGNLVQSLLKSDLVDELELWVFPVVIGSGKRVFHQGAIPTAWKLTRSDISTTGVVMLHYERAGDIVYGRPPGN